MESFLLGTSHLLWGVIAAVAVAIALFITQRKMKEQDRARYRRRLSAETVTLNGIKGAESRAVPSARDLLREVLFLYRAKLEGCEVRVDVAEGLEFIRLESRPRAFAALLSDLVSLSLESIEQSEKRRGSWLKIEIQELESSLQVCITDSSSMSFTVSYPKLVPVESLVVQAPARVAHR